MKETIRWFTFNNAHKNNVSRNRKQCKASAQRDFATFRTLVAPRAMGENEDAFLPPAAVDIVHKLKTHTAPTSPDACKTGPKKT